MTNKTEEFQSKFFGKVPAFESGATALCDDTAIAHFVGNQQTRGGEKTEEVKNQILSINRNFDFISTFKIPLNMNVRSSVGLDSPKLTFFQLLPSGFGLLSEL